MLENIVLKYFPELDSEKRAKISKLGPVYQSWNEKINVISRKDMEHFFERHVLHSLGIAKGIQFLPGTKVLDLGTGGGFPGIPLAILFPETDFLLCDSIGKKIKVAIEAAKEIGLKNIRTVWGRAEVIEEKFDFVVTRAVAPMEVLEEWTLGKFRKNQGPRNSLPPGIIALKGGNLSEELMPFGNRIQVFNLSNYFKEDFFLEKRVVFLKMG